jgi:PPOX class probable F420-dependent enzyme
MVDLTSKFGRVVKRHLNDDYVIWLTTVDSNLAPHPRPVWFIWEEDTFLIFSQANAHKVKHISKNQKVALHFNTDEAGEEHVIVFLGNASIDMTPEEFSREYSTAIRIRPTVLRGWD